MMSKTSKALLIIMLAALCYMGAVRAYQFYDAKVQAQKEAQAAEPVFNHVTCGSDEVRPKPTLWTPPAQDVFIEEPPLSAQLETQQAKETLESIFNDYKNDPALQQFNKDLKQATGGQVPDLESLSNQSINQIMMQNPQIGEVIKKNMSSADFQRVLNEIFSNPQFQESVKQIQGEGLGFVPAADE